MTGSNDKALLAKAASNVRPLISHLANEGTVIEDGEVANLLTATVDVDKLSPQDEAAFWKSYAALVKDALPARADAIYFAEVSDAGVALNQSDPDALKMRKQNISLHKMRFLSFVAFFVTLLLFAYLSIAESALQRSQSIQAEYDNLDVGVWKGTAIEKTYDYIQRETLASNGRAGSAEHKDEQSTTDSKEDRLTDLFDNRKIQLADLAGYNANVLKLIQLRWTSFSPPASDAGVLRGGLVSNALTVTQQSIDTLISKYLLPVFTALLGVTVFVMRTTSANFKQLSYQPYESGMLSNRLALGVVGGIAISWFSVTDTSGVVGSITPAALAFLVGYSVEILYNILDSLVKALGAGDKS